MSEIVAIPPGSRYRYENVSILNRPAVIGYAGTRRGNFLPIRAILFFNSEVPLEPIKSFFDLPLFGRKRESQITLPSRTKSRSRNHRDPRLLQQPPGKGDVV